MKNVSLKTSEKMKKTEILFRIAPNVEYIFQIYWLL